MKGKPLPQRLRLGPLELDLYLTGGLAYMRRLRAIEDEEERHLRELEEAWHALAEEARDGSSFAFAWREVSAAWDFRRLNVLIEKHNAYYPIEARVPMNPRTGGYARSWKRNFYDAAWVLDRFPPLLRRAEAPEASGSEPQSPPGAARGRPSEPDA